MKEVAHVIFFVTLKDIAAFFKQKKQVFLWMIFCMTAVSFAMNYAFSFNRYLTNGVKDAFESRARDFTVDCGVKAECEVIDTIRSEFIKSGLPEIKEIYLFNNSENWETVVGTERIYKDADLFEFDEVWLEIDEDIIASGDENICVVGEKLLDYSGRVTMVGEKFETDGEEFVIGGVVKGHCFDLMIPTDKFRERFSSCEQIEFFFAEALDSTQKDIFYRIIRENIEQSSVQLFKSPEERASGTYSSGVMQYGSVVLLTICCLIFMLEFWQDCNKTTYAVYWINGATKKRLVAMSILEMIILSLGTYLIGLVLSIAAQFVFPMFTSLDLSDIILGFALYMTCFIVSGAVISIRKMSSVDISDLRRDV